MSHRSARPSSSTQQPREIKVDPDRLPRHIAIIMDGNGRWANRQGLPRLVGHRQGVTSLKEIVEVCGQIGVEILTVYAFSTENWERPRSEVTFLIKLLEEVIENELLDLHRNKVQVRVIGRQGGLPVNLSRKIADGEALTKSNSGLKLNVCFDYGGRAEIIDAVNAAIEMVRNGQLAPGEKITEERFSDLIYTRGLPDPDLLIRTGGDYRISNFLLWQLAYAELWVTETCWPDFGRHDLLQAVAEFQRRDRRFGRI